MLLNNLQRNGVVCAEGLNKNCSLVQPGGLSVNVMDALSNNCSARLCFLFQINWANLEFVYNLSDHLTVRALLDLLSAMSPHLGISAITLVSAMSS